MTDPQITTAMRDLAIRQIDLAAHCVASMRISTENRRDILDAIALARGRIRAEGVQDITPKPNPPSDLYLTPDEALALQWLLASGACVKQPVDRDLAAGAIWLAARPDPLVEVSASAVGQYQTQSLRLTERGRALRGDLANIVLNADDRGNPA